MLQCRGMASAAFDLEEFVRNPSVAQFKAYHKAGLLELAEHYEVCVLGLVRLRSGLQCGIS